MYYQPINHQEELQPHNANLGGKFDEKNCHDLGLEDRVVSPPPPLPRLWIAPMFRPFFPCNKKCVRGLGVDTSPSRDFAPNYPSLKQTPLHGPTPL